MTATKASPNDVTLEQSPSGTWKLPKPRGNRLKPWRRLWIATAVIYLLMLAGSYYLLMPDQERIERRMVFAVTEEVRRYDGLAFAGESPRTIFENARSQGYTAWIAQIRATYHIGPEGNAGFERIDKNCQEAVADLPIQRTIGITFCIIAWLVPMAVLRTICSTFSPH